ncbi:CBS domain-containing protein [Candidatus Micrarchaeota archaeon]|nr:CBS domain-containing protein [Candidatus Micrarchaeota archaeon]
MKTEVKVGDVMTRGVITLQVNKTVKDAAKIMTRNKIGSIIVLKKGKAVGIMTERDIAKIVSQGKDPSKLTLEKTMTTPLKVINKNELVTDAALLLKETKIKRLPVIDDDEKLIGIVTEDDLISVFPGLMEILTEVNKIREYSETELFTGACDKCGFYSEALRKNSGRLLCKDCLEEEEV